MSVLVRARVCVSVSVCVNVYVSVSVFEYMCLSVCFCVCLFVRMCVFVCVCVWLSGWSGWWMCGCVQFNLSAVQYVLQLETARPFKPTYMHNTCSYCLLCALRQKGSRDDYVHLISVSCR